MTTSLERAVLRFGIPLHEAPQWEHGLLRDFKRRCHLVIGNLPELENDMEWLALLRHYGGPARLSDWTYSFWIGVHFAIENAEDGTDCELWGLDAGWWRARTERSCPELRRIIDQHGSNSLEESHYVLKMKGLTGLWFLSPFRLNDRLAAQQGAFVLPLDVTRPFMENLYSADTASDGCPHLIRYRLRITRDFLRTALKELHRMNINRMMLYPGISGLAQHYENAFGLPDLLGRIGSPR